MRPEILGTLVGDTGDPARLTVALASPFAVRRGEFVRIRHRERAADAPVDVVGRVVGLSRTHGRDHAGVTLVGARDPTTGQLTVPRRALDPGARVVAADAAFLRAFYAFDARTGLHLGTLAGYDRGADAVPVSLDVHRLVTEHLAVLAMTGAGKSYAVGRIVEQLVAVHHGTVVVFDPHGEYGRALAGGALRFDPGAPADPRGADGRALPRLRTAFRALARAGAGLVVYTPQDPAFARRYGGRNRELALPFDRLDPDDVAAILPGLTDAQQRALDAALRYWRHVERTGPRDIHRLCALLGTGLAELQGWDALTADEARALGSRSAAVASLKLARVLREARSFYSAACARPTDVAALIGRPADRRGRLVVVDLQGLGPTAQQVVTALLSSEILRAAARPGRGTRPAFLVYEEGHRFAPAGHAAVSLRVLRRIAGEGRKFGVGFAIVSQRPAKLDPDVTSQCNTLLAMRLKNPDDQRFLARASDLVGRDDLAALPGLATGEALVCGRATPAPLRVTIGARVLAHGGAAPDVRTAWGGSGR